MLSPVNLREDTSVDWLDRNMHLLYLYGWQNCGAKMKKLAGALLSLSFFLAAPAAAQEAPYSREDVIRFLSEQRLDLEKPRSVCIGADAKCAEEPQLKGFNMRIVFDFGSAELTEEAKRNLDVVADALEADAFISTKFRIEGHTDAAGPDEYNLGLSNERANAVMSYLESKDVSAERLKAIGYGKKYPLSNDLLAPENRRVELKIHD